MYQFLCTLVIKICFHLSDVIQLCISSPTSVRDMLFHCYVFIKISAQVSYRVQCMYLNAPMLIAMLAHFANCCGVPINTYSALEWFNFSFMPSIQVLISVMHHSMDSLLMSIEWWCKLQ